MQRTPIRKGFIKSLEFLFSGHFSSEKLYIFEEVYTTNYNDNSNNDNDSTYLYGTF